MSLKFCLLFEWSGRAPRAWGEENRGPEKSKENEKTKNMQNKKTIGLVVGFVVVALVFFFIGSSYGKGQAMVAGNNIGQNQGQNTGNFARGAGGQRGMRAGGGNVFGKVIAKDANSITVELNTPMGQNAAGATANAGTGSKIVFYTDKTTVMKTTDGTMADIAIGKNVTVQGTANPDGSVNAQNISIRPNIPLQAVPPKTN